MKRLAVGILAHVDAGKTTLSEGLLFHSGMIKQMGRVDAQNAFLDTEELERARGITIFSKQAVMKMEDAVITLVDTPGHVDFSAEMERSLWIMDYAVLVISGADGVQGHTLTLWRLLERYHIPVFLFVNKMDQPQTERDALLKQLQKHFGGGCVDFTDTQTEAFMEQIAVCDEQLMEDYLEGGEIVTEQIQELIVQRKVFPCYFGSALKDDGVKEFLQGLFMYTQDRKDSAKPPAKAYTKKGALRQDAGDGALSNAQPGFGARVFKIARDVQGNRLTYMKITSGVLKTRDMVVKYNRGKTEWEEKNHQIRIYSGEQFEVVQEAEAGCVCAVTGLTKTRPGDGLGCENQAELPVLEPVLTYCVELPEDVDAAVILPKLLELEEENPELHVIWMEETKSIQISMMGEVQIEILTKLILERYGICVKFDKGDIVYKETIRNVVEGVGHFEPLRHYAEVHLLLEPGEPGSGMQFMADCSEDVLGRNWQRLILTHLEEREHIGVLTGSALTDMRITVVSGRAHTKHTEGGDFRQATYRAVRQGLMQADSVLLEPYYDFRMELPMDMVGRAMYDIENMSGTVNPPGIEGEMAVLTGQAPVAAMRDYQITLTSYTKGRGSLLCTLKGYDVCHNSEEVIAAMTYNAEEDTANPSSSVFCSHGAGFIVPWNQVKDYMHVESCLEHLHDGSMEPEYDEAALNDIRNRRAEVFEYSIDEEQIEAILNRTFHANENAKKHWVRPAKPVSVETGKRRTPKKPSEKYMIVDGYNIVHAWEDLNCLVEDNLDGARMKLLDILSNYQAVTKIETIVVFDAYKVKGSLGEMFDYHNVHVVYTKEAETADTYIEKLTHKISKDYQVTVATSDGLVQLITRGNNCTVMSARELKEDIERASDSIRKYLS